MKKAKIFPFPKKVWRWRSGNENKNPNFFIFPWGNFKGFQQSGFDVPFMGQTSIPVPLSPKKFSRSRDIYTRVISPKSPAFGRVFPCRKGYTQNYKISLTGRKYYSPGPGPAKKSKGGGGHPEGGQANQAHLKNSSSGGGKIWEGKKKPRTQKHPPNAKK